MVEDCRLELVRGPRNTLIPSHVLYADDIMVFCNRKTFGLQALQDLFKEYALSSGQMISSNKSTIYSGSISPSRVLNIADRLGFRLGSLPFTYLGAPIFKGKPKEIHLQPIADKIKLKLSTWKASLLSMAGRVQLVKSVIQVMLIHTISIYSWPVSLLNDLEKCIRNLIWRGDIEKRKLVIVSWKKVCIPFDEGGLGLRSLLHLNEASNLRMCWELLTLDKE